MSKISEEEYQGAVLGVAMAARMIGEHDIPKLLQAIEMAHATGPIFDPTLYRAKMQAMEEDKRILEAGLPLWNLAKMLKERAEAARGGQLPKAQ